MTQFIDEKLFFQIIYNAGKEMKLLKIHFRKKVSSCVYERERKSFKYKLIDSNKTT